MVVSLRNFQAVDNRYLMVVLPSEETKYSAFPKNMAAQNKVWIPLEKEYLDIYFERKVHASLSKNLVKKSISSILMGGYAWDIPPQSRNHSGNFFNSALFEFL